MSPEKREMIRQQVFSKVQWGTEEEEVLRWLSEKAIPDDEAEQMYKEALTVKSASIRRKAVTMIVISSIGTVIGLILAAYSFMLDMSIRPTTIVGLVIGVPSIALLVTNIITLMSGKCDGPVE